jgi:hypothetical protein
MQHCIVKAVRTDVSCPQPLPGVWHHRFAQVKGELKATNSTAGVDSSVRHYARAEMVKLALLYSVVSPFTSLAMEGASVTSSSTDQSSASWAVSSAPSGAPVNVAYRYSIATGGVAIRDEH